MLLRGAASLLRRRLPPRPATASASTAAIDRHPLRPVHPGLRAPAPAAAAAGSIRRLSDFGLPERRRMARRIPPTRPEGYSTSDGEVDGRGAYWSEDGETDDDDEEAEEVLLERMPAEDVEAGKDWEGFSLEYDDDAAASEDEEKEEK
uniref:Uncharacterized protein n=1 Tax=Leersia perrieri TaxID=77586 RepID=A0A0D9WE48_9ORYZ